MCIRDSPLTPREERLTIIREAKRPRSTTNELDSQLVLESRHPTAHGRLGYAHATRRSAEGAELCDAHERVKRIEVQVFSCVYATHCSFFNT